MTTTNTAIAAAEVPALPEAAKAIAAKFGRAQLDVYKAGVSYDASVAKSQASMLGLVAEMRLAGVSGTAGKAFAEAVAAEYNKVAIAHNESKAGKAMPVKDALGDSYVKQLASYCNGLLNCSADDFAAATKGKTSLQTAYKALQDERRKRGEIKDRAPKTPDAKTAAPAQAPAIVANGIVPDDAPEAGDAKALIEKAAALLRQARETLKDQGADKETLKVFAATIGEVGDLTDLL